MALTNTLAGTDLTSQIDQNQFQVQQVIGTQKNTTTLFYKKFGSRSYAPSVFDTVLIQDGTATIFGGRVVTITETPVNPADGIVYQLDCADYSIDLDAMLVSQEYDGMTIGAIIADILANFATGFTGNNVSCGFPITKIIFNQVTVSQALKRLANIVQYDWYVDPRKDIHFFSKYTKLAAFNLTDTSGNYVNKSLQVKSDGTQIANSIKVRGGTYQGATFSDTITVKGSVTSSWVLPYKFVESTLTITINGVSKTVGSYGSSTFATKDVLYKSSDQSIQVQTPLSDGSTIAFSGTPIIPVLAIASDAASIALYGTREKLITDTSIVDIDTARVRAAIELVAYANPQGELDFDTYTPGLNIGQVINLTSAIRGINEDYIIRQMTCQVRTPTSLTYSIVAVSVRAFTFIDVLTALLQPPDMPIDPNEVSEIIKTDLATLTIGESITLHATPDHTDAATVTIGEVVAHDPLGTGVSPTWVLGPYIPSGTSDTKRVINIDHASAVLY
jgi:hypothetical protein